MSFSFKGINCSVEDLCGEMKPLVTELFEIETVDESQSLALLEVSGYQNSEMRIALNDYLMKKTEQIPNF